LFVIYRIGSLKISIQQLFDISRTMPQNFTENAFEIKNILKTK